MTHDSCVFMWTDRAMFIGARTATGAMTAFHVHPVIEVCLTLGQSIDMHCKGRGRGDESLALEGCPGAMVDANVKHQLTTRGPPTAVLYLDPGSSDAVALHRRLAGRSAMALSEDEVARWRDGVQELLADPGLEQAEAVCDRILDTLIGKDARNVAWRDRESAARRMDPRVVRVIELLRSNIERVMSVDELAASVELSEGRLRHLFRGQIGVPLRRYALWLRLRRALTVALSGQPMTDAAHAAGFSDAAHFTRTCRQMFGLPPTVFAPVDLFIAEPDQPDLVPWDEEGLPGMAMAK